MSADIAWWSLTRQVAAVKNREIDARQLAESYVRRLAAHDGRLASHVVESSSVLEQAAVLDAALKRGEDCGPLAGACISIKDNYLTAGMPTRVGTKVEALQFPETDSHVVAKLRRAGALVLGKVRMHEFAWGNITAPTRNPWNDDCVPGGSSGGSGAAVAAGLCSAAMGSDTGGSVRIPATLCGTVGLKPTFGLIGRSGIVPHSWSLDHAGPLTRTVEDCALLLEALVGPDAGDPSSAAGAGGYRAACSAPIKGRSVGVIRNHFSERLSEDVDRQFHAAVAWLRAEGVTVKEFDMPILEYGLGAIYAIELASASAYHDHAVLEGLTEGFQPDVRDLVDMGRLVTGVDYLHAEQVRSLMCVEFARIFEEVDAVVTPTSPITAWPSGRWEVEIQGTPESVLAASWRFTYPFNLTGLPAISVPAGFDRSGLPIGLQVVAKPFAENNVFAFAAAYERAHDWGTRRPKGYA
jgi:aspartyl-tRNA(Asn)/glutamyl-tRNA(Gln) amidotransferase subunit A